MAVRTPGIEFERIVAQIQQQVDPQASVTHNKRLTDRLGNSRQFDVVIEGRFAGQAILGVVECKDLKRRVGTQDVDAFVTKANDVRANFKILVSRRGFSTPAIAKAKHYGIQTLSLIPNDDVNIGFKVGNYWYADLYYWEQIALTLLFRQEPDHVVSFQADAVTIGGRPILQWFINYLCENHKAETKLGWTVGVSIEFTNDQSLSLDAERVYVCRGVAFGAKRALARKERFVGVKGTGFFDWQQRQITLQPHATITSDAVPTDFSQWNDRVEREPDRSGSIQITLVAHSEPQRPADPIALDSL